MSIDQNGVGELVELASSEEEKLIKSLNLEFVVNTEEIQKVLSFAQEQAYIMFLVHRLESLLQD